MVVVFAVFPGAFVALNSLLGWPRWQMGRLAVLGWALIAGGIGVAVHASTVFRRFGLGTAVPIEPPVKLVAAGAFRFSRNPIYVADLAVLSGMFLVRGEPALLLYVFLGWGALHLWVVRHEEPVLARRFGDEWWRYRERVPRWFGRVRRIPPPPAIGR